jgi:glycosyltransferase involved in cell wall biosynthesis
MSEAPGPGGDAVPEAFHQDAADRPDVSVVIPTRNRRHILPRTLASVLSQDGVELEVIVVDEASSDGTGPYLRELGDHRVRVVRHEEPRGPAQARNAGIELAAGRFVAFCDDDDLWAPDKLTAQLEALRRRPEAGWSSVSTVVVDERLRATGVLRPLVGPDVARVLLRRNMVGSPSGVMAATDLLRAVGGFDACLSLVADWDLWIRLALASPLVSCDRPLLAYVRHNQSLTGGMATFDVEYRYLRDKFADVRRRLGVDSSEGWPLHWVAESHARAGRRWPAVRRYLTLLRRHHDRVALKRMVAVLLWPGFIRLADRSGRRRVPPAWRAEVDAWLPRYAPTRGSA